jgi:3-methyl-2-oxobutanoate hydroxymethyltransferase
LHVSLPSSAASAGGTLADVINPIPGTRRAGLEEPKGTKMSDNSIYGASDSSVSGLTRKTRTHHLLQMKAEGERWAMLTAYDYSSARIFEEAGIPVLLVGDSAANVVYGYDTTVPITIDELLPLVRGVVRGAPNALVVADLPFGTYEASPQQALATATRFMKEGLANAVKLEGGERVADQIAAITAAGIPVMAHIGFTPQSVNGLGGFRVQGRGDGSEQLIADAIAVQEAGAFSVVMEMVPADVAGQVSRKLTIPTVGIGAGNETDAQVLVWQDMAGYTNGKTARFVKKFGNVGDELRNAASSYLAEVRSGVFPGPEHSY